MGIHGKLSLPPTHVALPFVNPDIFVTAQVNGFSPNRKDKKLSPADLSFKVVDVYGIRLYVVVFPMDKGPGIIGVWQNPGTGVSTRLAEYILPHLDTLKEVPFDTPGDGDVSAEKVPPPTWLPECEAHGKLRERITEILHRGALQPDKVKVKSDDVYLFPTGMASIYRAYDMATRWRRGTIVALGSIFHSTWHLFSDSPDGFKHFGACDATGNALEDLESYLQSEAKEGRKISFVFLEFPSNPILVSADLNKLHRLVSWNTSDMPEREPLIVDSLAGRYIRLRSHSRRHRGQLL
jgi:cystathionine gamma-synthase